MIRQSKCEESSSRRPFSKHSCASNPVHDHLDHGVPTKGRNQDEIGTDLDGKLLAGDLGLYSADPRAFTRMVVYVYDDSDES